MVGVALYKTNKWIHKPMQRSFSQTVSPWNSWLVIYIAISDYNIVSQAGSFYAIYLIESLGVGSKKDGGVVRIGFTHYNTVDEIEKVVNALKKMAQKAWL